MSSWQQGKKCPQATALQPVEVAQYAANAFLRKGIVMFKKALARR